MKKTYLLGLLLGLVAIPAVQAIQVTTAPNFGPWQSGPGGEFTLHIDSGLGNGSYAPSTRDQAVPSSFQTFCVEGGESIFANTTYSATLNSQSLNTGVPLSLGAAWVYSQFATGALSAYDYANTSDRKASAALLQHTIWALMGVAGHANDGSVFDLLVESQFGNWAAALAPAGANSYNVQILNLWGANDTAHQTGFQDVLYYHVPDGGMTVMLLGMGLSSLAFISRRIRS